MEKRWTNAELTDLKKSAASQTAEELALRFRTDADHVRHKLDELGLEAATPGSQHDEAAIEHFSNAVQLLHEQKWNEAVELFEKVIVESDGQQLADRARQHITICRQQIEAPDVEDDPYLQAVYEKNRGNLEAALELCQKSAANNEEHFAYLMASLRALDGSEDEALTLLATAIRLEPKNRIHAFHDPDFKALRGREEFSQLIQAP